MDKNDLNLFAEANPAVMPLDDLNQKLIAHVHPLGRENPKPPADGKPYHLVVIGGGTSGLVSAGGAALLGLRVALIEKSLMGGDCLNTGCVPSKALLKAAALSQQDAERDQAKRFQEVMRTVRERRQKIAPHDSVERFEKMGVDVYLGAGQFTSDKTIEVAGQSLPFISAIVATGARASEPDIPGLKEAGYLTNETVFSLDQLPESMAIIGGGPIGCEMAQAFVRLGSQVTLIERNERILAREDEQASQVLLGRLEEEGVTSKLESQVKAAETIGEGRIRLTIVGQNKQETLEVNQVLVATGRSPNIENLGLDVVGVEVEANRGILTNAHFQTSKKHIYACGDVVSGMPKFTHAADASARLIIRNVVLSQIWPLRWGLRSLAIGLVGGKRQQLVIPHCTYTQPEVAHVGDTRNVEEYLTIAFAENDRSVVETAESGFLKVGIDRKNRVKSATIVGENAGELLPLLTMAIRDGRKINDLGEIVYAYPTRAEIIRQLADEWTIRTLPRLKKTISPIFPK